MGITTTVAVAVCPPSTAVAVIMAVPTDTVVTTPVLLTVATAGLLLDHETLRFVALAGATVAVSVWLRPTVSVAALVFNVIYGNRYGYVADCGAVATFGGGGNGCRAFCYGGYSTVRNGCHIRVACTPRNVSVCGV